MKICSVIILLFALISNTFAGDCKTHRSLTRAEQIASLGPGGELDLLDLDLFDGGSFVAGYDYKVEPAYTAGLYSRTDGYMITTELTPKTDIDVRGDDVLTLSGGMKHDTQVHFIRYFRDPCRAMLTKPYSPKRIPFKADTALSDKFNIGDYFIFRGSIGFIASGEMLALMGPSFMGLTIGGSYLLEGIYQAHIVRMDKTHVRLKIVAQRGYAAEGAVGVGIEPQFNVFNVKFLDNGLENLVDIKPIEMKANLNAGKVFLVDYVLDLSDHDVARAYEAVIKKVKSFKSLSLAAPFRKIKDVEANVILNLAPLEDLYRQDYSLGRKDRISRNLRTNAEQKAYTFGLYLGAKILGFNIERETDTLKMSLKTADDQTEKYLLKAWDRNWDGKIFFGWKSSKHEDGIRILLKGDKDFDDITPVNLIKHITEKRTRLSYNKFLKIKKLMKKAMPISVFDMIPWEKWQQKKKETHLNFGMRFELHMGPESLMKAPNLKIPEIKVFFKDHLKSKGLTPEDYFTRQSDESGPSIEEQFESSLHQMAKNLEKVLDQGIPMTKRMDNIAKLRSNVLFSQSGLSFMMGLIPQRMGEWFNVNLIISSNQSSIDFTYGDEEISKLYKKVLTIKAALDDESVDLIRDAESVSTVGSGLLSPAE